VQEENTNTGMTDNHLEMLDKYLECHKILWNPKKQRNGRKEKKKREEKETKLTSCESETDLQTGPCVSHALGLRVG